MNTKKVFIRLDEELAKKGITRDIIICGGAALVSLGYTNRATADVDSITFLDNDFKKIADTLSEELKLKNGWLNSAVRSLGEDLPVGWETRAELIFSGKVLTVKSLSRLDLIFSKLYAAVDRSDDISDLIEMKITEEEINNTKKLVLEKDASEIWPELVEQCIAELRRRLRRG